MKRMLFKAEISFVSTLLFICLGLCNFLACAENSIKISEQDFNNLGVSLGKMDKVKQFPVLTAPAKVSIHPSKEFVISTSQPGLITRLNVATGDKVTKGEVLAQLDSPELLSMQQLYLKALNERTLGYFSYQRDKKLLAEGVIADRRWQETQSQYTILMFTENERRQLLKIAGMTDTEINQLAKTHKLSSLLTLYAPATGVVLDRLVATGERVNNLTPLYRIGILDELWLNIAIPQERVGNIKIGDLVLIQNTPVQAKINVLGQSVDPENQTILVRAVILKNRLLKKPQTMLRVGEKINVQIIQSTSHAVFKVPDSAIIQNEGKNFIFIRNPAGFLITPVTIMGKQDDGTVISGELTGAETIAVNGSIALKANWLGLGSDEK